MALQLVVSAVAEAQIRAVHQWWREFRPAAPDLFREELASAFEFLMAVPNAAPMHEHPTLSGVHRALLRATRYHVYYRVHDETIVVIAIWSAVRGSGPDLSIVR